MICKNEFLGGGLFEGGLIRGGLISKWELIRGGGAYSRGGLFNRGGLFEDLRYTIKYFSLNQFCYILHRFQRTPEIVNSLIFLL